jgi:hypothetical protein
MKYDFDTAPSWLNSLKALHEHHGIECDAKVYERAELLERDLRDPEKSGMTTFFMLVELLRGVHELAAFNKEVMTQIKEAHDQREEERRIKEMLSK